MKNDNLFIVHFFFQNKINMLKSPIFAKIYFLFKFIDFGEAQLTSLNLYSLGQNRIER